MTLMCTWLQQLKPWHQTNPGDMENPQWWSRLVCESSDECTHIVLYVIFIISTIHQNKLCWRRSVAFYASLQAYILWPLLLIHCSWSCVFIQHCINALGKSLPVVSDGPVLLCGQSLWCTGEIGPGLQLLGRQEGGVRRCFSTHLSKQGVQVHLFCLHIFVSFTCCWFCCRM